VALIGALQLALEPRFRRILRQCALPSCRRFALGTPQKHKGHPRNFYCSADEAETHQRQLNNERQQAYKASVTVKRFRARKAREQRSAMRRPK
jgi:hypothetical protein